MELNKIFAALLVAGIIALGSALLSDGLYVQEIPEQQAFVIAPEEEESTADAADQAAPEEEEIPSVLPLLASADPAAGQDLARACTACHSFDEGGPSMVGPNNWDVVGSVMGHVEGFNYSDGLNARHEAGDTWTYESLDAFLLNPGAYIPGTSMVYAGISDVQDRAHLIAWLRTLSNDPVPLPTEEEISAATGESAAEEAEPAEGEPSAEGAPAEETAAPATAEEPASDASGDEAPASEPAAEEPAVEESGAVEEPSATEEEPSSTDATDSAAATETDDAPEGADAAAPTTPQAGDEAAGDEEPAGAPTAAEETDPATPTDADAVPDSAAADDEAMTGQETAAEHATAEAWQTPGDLVQRLAAADPAGGQGEAAICMACHNFDPGGPNLMGPNNWDIVGAPIGHADGFTYTQGLQDRRAAGDVWTFESLDNYIRAPMEYVPGTTMAFAGVADDQARADIIAWLSTLSDDPVPLPRL